MDRIGSEARPLRVAIVGSGPGGFFAARALLGRRDITVDVDMFERLPTPYGLVRGGVAPDHQSIKSVARTYERSAADPRFRFFGNTTVGRDVPVTTLAAHYDQIVLAVGNEASRRLGIPNEGIPRSVPASVFVGWYNGHPDYRGATIDLSVSRVAVVGNGNVAVDVARLLCLSADELARTDVPDYALAVLSASRVREVIVLGRRGPLQAAFTPAELKELGELSTADPVVAEADLVLDPSSEAALASADSRARRNLERLEAFAQRPQTRERQIILRFLASPAVILSAPDGGVGGLRIERNRLVSGPRGELRAEGTGEFEDLDVGMVLSAVGYSGRALPGVPFDPVRRVIANQDGRVFDPEAGRPVDCLYVVGWARSGPQGLIGAHKQASAEVVDRMLEDLAAGAVPARALPPMDAIREALDRAGVAAVSFTDWKTLDAVEVSRGDRRGAPRVKVSDVPEMLRLMRPTE